ncbi:MAG: extensin family protein, partial [Propionibacteriaceae bacterium]
MPFPVAATALSRRQLLGLVGVGTVGAAATLLTGCSVGPTSDQTSGNASCVSRASLESHRTLSGLPLVYEVTQKRAAFSFDGGFFTQLGAWLTSYTEASGLAAPDQVWNYGGWINGGSSCDSWHNSGRALDLGRLRLEGGDFVSCRYDQWRSESGAALEQRLRQYWALAASLHLHFAYVLTYLYNDQHANHIHVDNGRSGEGPPRFSSRSRVQVQAVQAVCQHVWS